MWAKSQIWRHWLNHFESTKKITQLVEQVRAWSRWGEIGAIAPLKPTKVTLFTITFYNSENSIRDIKPFCRPLFCHSSVVKCSSSLLQQWTRNETWLPDVSEIAPPLILLAWCALGTGQYDVIIFFLMSVITIPSNNIWCWKLLQFRNIDWMIP